MEIRVTDTPISLSGINELAAQQFGNLIKATVDVEKGVIAIGGELHADEEQVLLDAESEQRNLWGINLYPKKFGTEDFVEFDSMINLRPSQGNMSRGVEREGVRKQIWDIVGRLIVDDNESGHAT